MPTLASDCQSAGICAPGSIRERYRIDFRKGKAPRPAISIECRFPDVISQGRLDYAELVNWVTGGCPDCAEDPSIALADICLTLDGQGGYSIGQIDITTRPIVYSNDLLFDLLTSLLTENPKYRRGK